MKRYEEFNPKLFGERVKECRERLELSREKFLEKFPDIGVGINALTKWEQGKIDGLPRRTDSLIAFCNAVGCDLDYLLGRQDEMTRELTDIHAATGLSEKAIKTLMGWMNNEFSPYPDFINYAIEHGLLTVAASITDLRGTNSTSEILFNMLPTELKEIVERRKHLNHVKGGALPRYETARDIAELFADTAKEKKRKSIVSRCERIHSESLFAEEVEKLERDGVTLPIFEEVKEYIKAASVSGVNINVDMTEEALKRDVFTAFYVLYVCSYYHALNAVLMPANRFSISNRFNRIIDNYLNETEQDRPQNGRKYGRKNDKRGE